MNDCLLLLSFTEKVVRSIVTGRVVHLLEIGIEKTGLRLSSRDLE